MDRVDKKIKMSDPLINVAGESNYSSVGFQLSYEEFLSKIESENAAVMDKNLNIYTSKNSNYLKKRTKIVALLASSLVVIAVAILTITSTYLNITNPSASVTSSTLTPRLINQASSPFTSISSISGVTLGAAPICPEPSTCYLLVYSVGPTEKTLGNWTRHYELLVSHDQMKTWQNIPLPSQYSLQNNLSCQSSLDCEDLASDSSSTGITGTGPDPYNLISTQNGWKSWTVTPINMYKGILGGGYLIVDQFTCSSISTCYGTGGIGPSESPSWTILYFDTHNSGKTWAAISFSNIAASHLNSTSWVSNPESNCLSETICLFTSMDQVGSSYKSTVFPITFNSTNNTWEVGKSITLWSNVLANFGYGTCANNNYCTYIFNPDLRASQSDLSTSSHALLAYSTNNGGLSWKLQFLNGISNMDVVSVACVSSQLCWIAGSTHYSPKVPSKPLIYLTYDGGLTWHNVPTDKTNGSVVSLTCSISAYCFGAVVTGSNTALAGDINIIANKGN